MGSGLRDLLGLPETNAPGDGASSELADALRERFRAAMDVVNDGLRTVAAHAPADEHNQADAQRDKLVTAYQQVTTKLKQDSGAVKSADVDRVLTAADSLGKKSSTLASQAKNGHQEWSKREGDFDETSAMVTELEEAGYADVEKLRRVIESIRDNVVNRSFGAAVDTLEKVGAKVQQIYGKVVGDEGQVEGKNEAKSRVVPGGGGYQYEQFPDGRIFIIESPRSGKTRIQLKEGGKAFKAVLAEIGPFPTASEPATPTEPSADASRLLETLLAARDSVAETLGEFVDGASEFLGLTDDEAEENENEVVEEDDSEEFEVEVPEIMGGAETETEKKLAEFTQAMMNIEVEVDGETVSVRPPYHWNRRLKVWEKELGPDGKPVIDEKTGKPKLKAVIDEKTGKQKKKPHKILKDALDARSKNPKVNDLMKQVFKGDFGKGAKVGKATPEQMQKFLEESLKQGLIKDKSAAGMKEYLDTYGVSTDCSGLMVQALNFLEDGDTSRSGEEIVDIGNTGTGTIHDYKKVKKPSDLRAGDAMVKKGHVRLITDVDIEDDGVYFTTLESTTANVSEHGKGVGERRWKFKDPNKFKDIQSNKSGKFKHSSGDDVYIYTRHSSLIEE